MGRVDELRERYEAELAVVELEDELASAKEDVERCGECGRRTSADFPELRDLKTRVREARRMYRKQREGAADVSPAVIEVAADLPAPGGAE